MYKTIFFDLDGTLTDPAEGITNSVAYALKKYGITVADKASLYKFIGPPLTDAFSEYYGFSKEKALEAVEFYREYFRDKGIFENKVYEGIAELLQKLKEENYTIILATSKPEEFAEKILKHFNLFKYFDCIAGAAMDGSRIKKADVILYAMEKHGTDDLNECVMIGDREHDIIGASKTGMDSIGVLYGYGSYDELKNTGATYIAENVSDIYEIIKKS